MKKRNIFLLATMLIAGAATAVAMGQVQKISAAGDPESEAKQTIYKFLDAGETKNMDEFSKVVIDHRFDGEEQLKSSMYKEMAANNDKISDTKIISDTVVSPTEVDVTISFHSTVVGSQIQTYPVVKKGNDWFVVIEKDKHNMQAIKH